MQWPALPSSRISRRNGSYKEQVQSDAEVTQTATPAIQIMMGKGTNATGVLTKDAMAIKVAIAIHPSNTSLPPAIDGVVKTS